MLPSAEAIPTEYLEASLTMRCFPCRRPKNKTGTSCSLRPSKGMIQISVTGTNNQNEKEGSLNSKKKREADEESIEDETQVNEFVVNQYQSSEDSKSIEIAREECQSVSNNVEKISSERYPSVSPSTDKSFQMGSPVFTLIDRRDINLKPGGQSVALSNVRENAKGQLRISRSLQDYLHEMRQQHLPPLRLSKCQATNNTCHWGRSNRELIDDCAIRARYQSAPFGDNSEMNRLSVRIPQVLRSNSSSSFDSAHDSENSVMNSIDELLLSTMDLNGKLSYTNMDGTNQESPRVSFVAVPVNRKPKECKHELSKCDVHEERRHNHVGESPTYNEEELQLMESIEKNFCDSSK